jgi:hypothetical protein
LIQYQYTQGLVDSGGLRKACSSDSEAKLLSTKRLINNKITKRDLMNNMVCKMNSEQINEFEQNNLKGYSHREDYPVRKFMN